MTAKLLVKRVTTPKTLKNLNSHYQNKIWNLVRLPRRLTRMTLLSVPFLMYWVAIIEEMSPEEIQRCHKYTSGSC